MKTLTDIDCPAPAQMSQQSLRFTDAAMASEVAQIFEARAKASATHDRASCPAWKSVFDAPVESKPS